MFQPEIPILGKFVLDLRYPFWANLVQKNQNCSKWNLVLRLIWILRIQKTMLAFRVSDRKCLFWANFVPKIKIISLSWNLIPILIGICRIQWCCSICLFRPASFFVQKLHLPFWYCLINLSAVYLQRLEASGFSCYKCNY